jgi:adenylate cyclase
MERYMNEQDVKTLRHLLDRSQRMLDLIMAIDTIRDSDKDPASMLSSIVNLVADEFDADLCLLVLIDRDTGKLELKAINDRSNQFGKISPDSIRELAERAIKTDAVDIWEGPEVCSALGIDDDCQTQLAVVPIIMGTKIRLGVLLLTRKDRPFEQDDVMVLRIAESQLDSAVIQGYDYYELDLRNKELETIYRVDRIRDEKVGFDEMLDQVLEELRSALQAEMGFIMLYNHAGEGLELRAVSHDDLFKVTGTYDTINAVANESLEQAHLIHKNEMEGSLSSVMCIPLILHDEILGVFGVANSRLPGFEERERRLLMAIASQMDTAIFESLAQRQLRRVLGRSVDPQVMERLLSNPDVDFLKGERQVLTVLYSDIRGSTSLAERTEPELLVGFINDYLGKMSSTILKYEGTLDKFVGDEVMALFGAPFPQPDHALRAVRVALEMQLAHQDVIEKWVAQGVDAAPIGIGIATGELIVGEMGSSQRTDYTVIGRAANLGARICSAAKPGQVLISQETYEQVMGKVDARPISGLAFKGVSSEVTVYEVTQVLE